MAAGLTLKKKYKKMWLEALRSGKFKQVQGRLYRDSGGGDVSYCCLGVLCEVVDPEELFDGWRNRADLSDNIINLAFTKKSVEQLDHDIKEDSSLGLLGTPYSRSYRTLAALNDSANLNFSEIADVIEEQM